MVTSTLMMLISIWLCKFSIEYKFAANLNRVFSLFSKIAMTKANSLDLGLDVGISHLKRKT